MGRWLRYWNLWNGTQDEWDARPLLEIWQDYEWGRSRKRAEADGKIEIPGA